MCAVDWIHNVSQKPNGEAWLQLGGGTFRVMPNEGQEGTAWKGTGTLAHSWAHEHCNLHDPSTGQEQQGCPGYFCVAMIRYHG